MQGLTVVSGGVHCQRGQFTFRREHADWRTCR
jgi:hypothetical protein